MKQTVRKESHVCLRMFTSVSKWVVQGGQRVHTDLYCCVCVCMCVFAPPTLVTQSVSRTRVPCPTSLCLSVCLSAAIPPPIPTRSGHSLCLFPLHRHSSFHLTLFRPSTANLCQLTPAWKHICLKPWPYVVRSPSQKCHHQIVLERACSCMCLWGAMSLFAMLLIFPISFFQRLPILCCTNVI